MAYGSSVGLGSGYYRSYIGISVVTSTNTYVTYRVTMRGQLYGIDGFDSDANAFYRGDWNGSQYVYTSNVRNARNYYGTYVYNEWFNTNYYRTYDFTVYRTKSKQTRWHQARVNIAGNGNSDASTSITIDPLASYTVSFNANGGSGAPSNQTKWLGESLTLSSTIPTLKGFEFLGWATSKAAADAGTVSYLPGASYTANAALSLYAVWKRKGSIHVVDGGEWKQGVTYVKDNNQWNQGVVYLDDGSWKQGI